MTDPFPFRRPVREITGPRRTHPWQDGPAELITHGLQHMHLNREDFDRRMAFLLFDLGIETLFKTFLLLDKGASGAEGSYTVRSKAATSESFHEIVEGTRTAGPDRLSDDDAKHVLHYHDIRNRLYHRGNGITVPEHHVQDYAELAVRLLRVLLDIDLSDFLREPDRIQREEKAIAEKHHEVRAKLDEIREVVTEIIDLLAPRLLHQRTWQLFNETLIPVLQRAIDYNELLNELGPRHVRGSPKLGIVTRSADLSVLPLSEIDRFFTYAIEDDEVRDYFLSLPQEDRRAIVYSLVESNDADLLEFDYDEADDRYDLSVHLLDFWPDWPYDHNDFVFTLARSYLSERKREFIGPRPPVEIELIDAQGETVKLKLPVTDTTLLSGETRFLQLQPIYDRLKVWYDERAGRKWGELPT